MKEFIFNKVLVVGRRPVTLLKWTPSELFFKVLFWHCRAATF